MTHASLRTLPIAIIDHVKQASIILRQLCYDRGIWRWCAIFTGLYIGSRLFFYKFYYPALVRSFSPPSFFQSDDNIDAKQLLSKQSSISNAFPQSLLKRISIAGLHSDSLYSQKARLKNSQQASAKLMSLTHSILTVHKGLKCINTLNLTAYAISRGIDYIPIQIKTDHPLALEMVNMNTSYALIDLIIVEVWQRGNISMILHHIVVVLGGLYIKYRNKGSAIWLFGYGYADIPTIILHSLWFARNIGINLKSLFALFNKESVKESGYLEGDNDIAEEINTTINMVSKIEGVLLVGFSASFLYIRCVLFSKAFLLWMWHSVKSQHWDVTAKAVGITCIGTMTSVGYWWSYRLVMKIREILAENQEEELLIIQKENEEEEAVPRFNQKIKRLSSVDEQQSEP